MIAIGLGLYLVRKSLTGLTQALTPLTRFAQNGFGFEWLNQEVINLMKGLSSAMRVTQTGQLNWNIVGIVGGLGILLTILVWGA